MYKQTGKNSLYIFYILLKNDDTRQAQPAQSLPSMVPQSAAYCPSYQPTQYLVFITRDRLILVVKFMLILLALLDRISCDLIKFILCDV